MNSIIAIAVVAVLVMLFGVINKKSFILPTIFSGLTVALFLNFGSWNFTETIYNGMFVVDKFGMAFNGVLIFTTILVFVFASIYYKSIERPLEDIYSLILFALIGALVMTSFGNLIMLFVGLETLSISLYILAGSKKFDSASNEAAMKYFLMGSFATGFLLFGIALLYGASGTFDVTLLGNCVKDNSQSLPTLFYVGMMLVVSGMAFKIAAVPFHFWAPDVYAGSPTLITSFMATVGKVAGIAAFYRLASTANFSTSEAYTNTLWFFAVATILVGNISAIYQDNIKRMFAYSGISHAGYLLLALIAMGPDSAGTLLYYSLSYSVATILAFAVLMLIREERHTFSIKAFSGLAKTNPFEAFAMTIAMMSMAGIPPLAGFMAKYHIFILAMEKGFLWLVIFAVVGSMISIYYYFKPIMAMYFGSDEGLAKIQSTQNYKTQILVCALLLILFGLIPGWVISLV